MHKEPFAAAALAALTPTDRWAGEFPADPVLSRAVAESMGIACFAAPPGLAALSAGLN